MTMQTATTFHATEIPNFNRMTKEIQEHVLILPSYFAQMALSQQRIKDLTYENSVLAMGYANARAGEQFLFSWLKINVIRMVWEILLDYPLQQEIHPAITVVRDAELNPIDVQITEDLRPWLPVHSIPCGAG